MTHAPMTPISLRLAALRKAKGLTQAQLAEKSGVPQGTISRMETGQTGGVDLANLEKLANALGVAAGFLIVHEPEGK